jgi:hypothetical protein
MRLFRPDPNLERLARHLHESESRYLAVLRREVANLIIATEPDLMVRCYEKAWSWERETAGNPERLRAEEMALVAKFPMFQDFDVLGIRHFVPYDEVRRSSWDDDLVERYLDLSRMLVFMKNRDRSTHRPFLHGEDEYKVLQRVVRELKDHQFRARIEDALRRCHSYQQGLTTGGADPFAAGRGTYADADVEVFRMVDSSIVDIETGIIFKKTEEYGIHSFFLGDDGHQFHSYYRTDRNFVKREAV